MNEERFDQFKDSVPREWVQQDGAFVRPVQVFLDELYITTRSERFNSIVRDYLRSLRYFCELHHTTPQRMIKELEQQEKLTPTERFRSIRLQLKQFEEYCRKEKGLSNNTTITAITHIRSFLQKNGFSFTYRQQAWQITTDKKRLDKAQVIELLENAESLRDRALIHLLWSSGQSPIDITKMNRDDVTEYGEWAYVVRQREKTKRQYVAPITPECLAALKLYLKRRNDSDPALIVVTERGETPNRITAGDIHRILRRIALRMALCKAGQKNPIRPKTFRTAFNVSLKLAGVDSELVEYLMGHAQGVKSHYGQFPPEKVMDIVKQHYDALRLRGAPANNHIEEEVAHLKDKVARLEKLLHSIESHHYVKKKPRMVTRRTQ